MAELTLDTFEFDVVTVNAQGQETSRQRGQAQSFTEDLGNGVGLEMVFIPGGSFQMGSPAGEGLDQEKPQHSVTVKPFFIGKFPVTKVQWQAVIVLPALTYALGDHSGFQGNNRPVECVNWFDASECCDRLSAHTGRQYRLPSEAEWEYACRAGTNTPFHFGETLTTDLANYSNSRGQTTDVGIFPPNTFGLYDLHGNVSEWCLDHWLKHYAVAPTDMSIWLRDGASRWLTRGGAWHSNLTCCRSAYRGSDLPHVRDLDLGLRVVCSAP